MVEWAERVASGKKKRILLVNLGQTHDDTHDLASALKKKGFDAEIVDLNQTPFSQIDFSNVAVVDLHDCRGWYRELEFFEKQLEDLKRKIVGTGLVIPVINDPEVFKFVRSKLYLKYFVEQAGIPAVQTEYIYNPSNASATGQLTEFPSVDDIFRNRTKVVIKPASGSRADNVIFIKKEDENKYVVTSPQSRDGAYAPINHTITYTKESLAKYLHSYRDERFREQQSAILIQDYCEGTEVSAVFIGDSPHFIRREKGVKREQGYPNEVAHELYYGTNHIDLGYSADQLRTLQDFASDVKNKWPDKVPHPAYLRVDMMYNGTGEPKLLEIEAGSSRLFLKESNRVGDYAEMLAGRARASAQASDPSPFRS